ncbi:hypothetical protein [Promicromonospora soli]|uniref:Uncharacterized protein n=1 Tax=Promicromonospora soli TaxID=2035533 RepID=A0A919G9G4_9MICO|nr:hypothetical protein [Promicromonospora soli]GHH80224.1 hypothetical protein GCM10017772_47830 [Promicromonospora soli]
MYIAELVPVAILVVLLLVLITVNSTGRAVDRVERKVDRVIKHLGIEGPAVDGILPETLAEIDRCIWSDRRAEATRLYRQATGHTAVEARAWIERRVASY